MNESQIELKNKFGSYLLCIYICYTKGILWKQLQNQNG